MYSKMPTKPKICIYFRFGLPTNKQKSPKYETLKYNSTLSMLSQYCQKSFLNGTECVKVLKGATINGNNMLPTGSIIYFLKRCPYDNKNKGH